MRIHIFILCSVLVGTLQTRAQDGNFSRITVRDSIWLNGKWIKGIADDASFNNPATNMIPSQRATKTYINTRAVFTADSALSAQKGKAAGIASLDVNGRLPQSSLPGELDPVFTRSVAAAISLADIQRWSVPVDNPGGEIIRSTLPVRQVSANAVIRKNGGAIIFNTGNIQATLPDPAVCSQCIYVLRNMSRNGAVTFNYAIKTFPGGGTTTSLFSGASLWIISDGVDWYSIL